MNNNQPLTPKRIAWLQLRLQRCEKRILNITSWDVDDYMGLLSRRGCRLELKTLLEKRRSILNEMFDYTPNEVHRLEELNNSLYDLTQQMQADYTNVITTRQNMFNMEDYDDDTQCNAELTYRNMGKESVAKMIEDEYYGSQFDKMLNILSEEDHNFFPYPYDGMQMDDGQSWAEWIDDPRIEHLIICFAVHDLFDHHLYSVPDILRMTTFDVTIKLKQSRIITNI